MLVKVRMNPGESCPQMLGNEALVPFTEAEMLGNEALVPFWTKCTFCISRGKSLGNVDIWRIAALPQTTVTDRHDGPENAGFPVYMRDSLKICLKPLENP